ncbi:MAG: hypothetical protein KKB88_05915 [Nanoarchaeota archaeon]|nr:hypothetical protein [Nanoarchaeota archaeon]
MTELKTLKMKEEHEYPSEVFIQHISRPKEEVCKCGHYVEMLASKGFVCLHCGKKKFKPNHTPKGINSQQTKPVMRVFSKKKFRQLANKYEFTTTIVNDKVRNAKNIDVLVLQTNFRNGKHWIDNAWVLNEESPEVFMELMFGRNHNLQTKSASSLTGECESVHCELVLAKSEDKTADTEPDRALSTKSGSQTQNKEIRKLKKYYEGGRDLLNKTIEDLMKKLDSKKQEIDENNQFCRKCEREQKQKEKDFLKELKEGMIYEWDFCKKAKVEPSIHPRRIIEFIDTLSKKHGIGGGE